MKNILPIIVTILISSPTYAQNFWQKVNGVSDSITCLTTDRGGMVYAMRSNGDMYRSTTNNGQQWELLTGLKGKTPYVIDTISSGGIIVFYGADPYTHYHHSSTSTDSGQHWVYSKDSVYWAHDIASSGGNIFVGVDDDGVYRSTDNGGIWKKSNNGLPFFPTVLSLAISPKTGRIFASARGNKVDIYNSIDGGNTWKQTQSVISGKFCSHVAVDVQGNVVTTTDSAVYRSINDGAGWTHVGDLPAQIDACLALNSVGHMFVTTNNGIYRSTDNGTNWEQINTGLTGTVSGLTFDKNGVIYAGTKDGLYRSMNSTTSSMGNEKNVLSKIILDQNYPNPFSYQTTIQLNGSGLFEVRDILGRVVYQTKVEGNSINLTFDGSNLSNGMYWYSFRDRVTTIQSRSMIVAK